MRVAQHALRRSQKSRTVSITAPVSGWNARDPLAEMQPTDAVILDNFFCTPFDVVLRSGCSSYATGISGTVNTLTSYSPPASSARRLFAFAGANVYDISASGAVGTPAVAGISSDKCQVVNFGTAGGNFLVAVNGLDLPLVFNGTVWTNAFSSAFNTAVTSITSSGTTATVTMANPHNLKTGMSVTVAGFTPAGYNGTYVVTITGASTFTYTLTSALGVTTVTGTIAPTLNLTITGVDPTLFANVTAFKARLWFIEKNSLRAWYMPTLSIGGAAQVFDFSSIFTSGGYLVAMGDWSLDAGQGMDDYAVFVTSEGQVAVYKGTDPANASTWGLVGVYSVGSPIGRRCFTKYAGDLTLIGQDGLSPLSKSLMSSRVNTHEALTDKIQHVVSDYVSNYGDNFGWETVIYPKENMLLVNVPASTTLSYQLVMNTITGAWSRYTGWNAACFELHKDTLYFGTAGGVCRAWDTTSDGGNNINFEALQSFNYMGRNTQQKQVQMVRPLLSTNGTPSFLLGVNVDFDKSLPAGVPTFSSPSLTSGVWGNGTWSISTWAGATALKKDWQTCYALGYCMATHLMGSGLNITLRWAATDYVITDGGIL